MGTRYVNQLPEPGRTRARDAIASGFLPALPGDFLPGPDVFGAPTRALFHALFMDHFAVVGRFAEDGHGLEGWTVR